MVSDDIIAVTQNVSCIVSSARVVTGVYL